MGIAQLFKNKRRVLLFTSLVVGSLIFVFVFLSNGRIKAKIHAEWDPLHDYNGPTFKVLISGGSGFIGSHVVEYFQRKSQCSDIIVLDPLVSGNDQNLAGFAKVRFYSGGIENSALVDEIFRDHPDIQYVFHLGALISAPESVSLPEKYFQVNTVGTLQFLKKIDERDSVKSVLFASSAAIYGQDKKLPKTEHLLPDCQTAYAQTKLDGEFLLNHFNRFGKNKNFKGIATRFFNVFGERQDPNSAYAAVIPKFIEGACVKREKLTIFGSGEQTRDFVYVKDVVQALVHLSFNVKKQDLDLSVSHGIVFNVGYGFSISINELAAIVHGQCPGTGGIDYQKGRDGDVMHSRSSNVKLRSTGWKQRYDMMESLEKTVKWFRKKMGFGTK